MTLQNYSNVTSNAIPVWIYCEPSFYFSDLRLYYESISCTEKYYSPRYWCYTWQRLDGDVTYP